MAKHTQVILIDDLDGSKADESLTFGIDGTDYEIDLSKTHAETLRKALEPFVKGGRKAPHTTPTGRRRTPRGNTGGGDSRSAARVKSAAARAWAKANGIQISERGRIPADVMEQYERANP